MDVNHSDNNKGYSMPTQSPRAATSGPQTQRKRPGDLTGTQGQRLAQERDEAQEAALADAAVAKQADRAVKTSTVVDYTKGGVVREPVVEVDVPEEPQPTTMRIRVNYPIENMTFGKAVIKEAEFDERGIMTSPPVLGNLNSYDFVEGQVYDVPWELGAHLKDLGYVYDF